MTNFKIQRLLHNQTSVSVKQSKLCHLFTLIREQPDFEGSRGESMEGLEGFPTLELLMQKTEKITKKIQELLLSAQERNIAW